MLLSTLPSIADNSHLVEISIHQINWEINIISLNQLKFPIIELSEKILLDLKLVWPEQESAQEKRQPQGQSQNHLQSVRRFKKKRPVLIQFNLILSKNDRKNCLFIQQIQSILINL